MENRKQSKAEIFFYRNAQPVYQDCISPDECIRLLELYAKESSTFTPPTAREVMDFFIVKTQGSETDAARFAEKFIAHYELKDWKYATKKMKDWKRAAVAAWDMEKFVTTKQLTNGQFGKGTSKQGLDNLFKQFDKI
jgi:hypothetical protein